MSHCEEGLARVAGAIRQYQQANGGQYPASLESLVEGGVLSAWDLVCPAGPHGVGQCSYVYRGADLTAEAPDELIVAYDRQPWHKGRRNILFADGQVRRRPEGVFESSLARDNRLREEAGLAARPLAGGFRLV